MKTNNSGFTVIEVMTGIALMGIVTYGIISGTAMLFSTEARTGTLGNENKIIQGIVENISANPAIYQKNFITPTVSTDSILAPANLPLAYGKDYLGDRQNCPTPCGGYIGYVIRPIPTQPGLFEVTLRLYKLTEDPNQTPETKDYVFMTQSN